jgi:hypothetical protein
MAAIIVGPTNWQPEPAEKYRVQVSSLGDQMIRGGYLICRTGGSVAWIVAPASSEVSRNWYNINDAVTTATNSTSATGWFVPTIGQLQNPGYECRTYWDSYSSGYYWSGTQYNVCFAYINIGINNKVNSNCVRAFRCVIY